MYLRLVSLFVLSLTMTVTSTPAAVVTYTLTGGTINGTLKGVAFSGVNYSITADADPSSFVSGAFTTPAVLPISYLSAVSTMTIDGFAPFQITSANFGPFILDAALINGQGSYYGGFGVPSFPSTLFGFAAIGNRSGDPIAGPGAIAGLHGSEINFTLTTTGGDLYITGSTSGPALFTASGNSAVPEPTSMAIFGLGALGFAYRNRRRILNEQLV